VGYVYVSGIAIIVYRRVSTTEQADSGLGLEAQTATITRSIDTRSWSITAELTDEGVSGSMTPADHPALAQALKMPATGEADTLLVAKLDRATRSVADLCQLLELSDHQGWDFITLDLGIDTNGPCHGANVQRVLRARTQDDRPTNQRRLANA
jgi:DNA invertase Pin-like site-specific DNA recombinase